MARQRRSFRLNASGDPVETAARLFMELRELNRFGRVGIAVMAVPEEELGLAINDRLQRAAAPRG